MDEINKTVHFDFTIEGPDADQVDVYASLLAMEMDFKINRGEVKVYYTEQVKPVEKSKEEKEKK